MILISNDDGYDAPGVHVLREVLDGMGYGTRIIAPVVNNSGVGSALTLGMPINYTKLDNNDIKVQGTPADCVHLGVSGAFGGKYTRVIAGINNCYNLGDDVWYSGTYGAALQGRFLALSGIAISMDSPADNTATLYKWLPEVLQLLFEKDTDGSVVYNVNIPNIAAAEVRGVIYTCPGDRLGDSSYYTGTGPHGEEQIYLGKAGSPDASIVGTDFYAVASKYISISVLNSHPAALDARTVIGIESEVLV